MKKLITIAFGMLLLAGCSGQSGQEPQYDDAASKEFVAAWSKKQTGDTTGANAALQALIGKYPNSRAAARAKQLLAAPPPAPTPTPVPTPVPTKTPVPEPDPDTTPPPAT